MADTANQDLYDKSVIHASQTYKYSNGVALDILDLMEESEDEQRKYLLDNFDPDDNQSDKRKVLLGLLSIEATYAERYKKIFDDSMLGLSKNEKNFNQALTRGVLDRSNIKKVTINNKSAKYYRDKLYSKPMVIDNGQSISVPYTIDGLYRQRIDTIKRSFTGSLNNRDSSVRNIVDKIYGRKYKGSKKINYQHRGGNLRANRNNVVKNVRTVVNHAVSTTQEVFTKLNKHIYKGYQLVATLDNRTSAICISLDGKTWIYDREDLSTLSSPMIPPFHRNCRTVVAPIIIEGLGGDVDSVDKDYINGEIIGELRGEDWFSRQSFSTQKAILGKQKAYIYSKGELKFSDLVTPDNEVLTLEQLKQRDIINTNT